MWFPVATHVTYTCTRTRTHTRIKITFAKINKVAHAQTEAYQVNLLCYVILVGQLWLDDDKI